MLNKTKMWIIFKNRFYKVLQKHFLTGSKKSIIQKKHIFKEK